MPQLCHNVRGSYSAVHRVFVLHIVEKEAGDQENERDDRREGGQQEEEKENRRESEQPRHEHMRMGWSEMCAARQT